MSDVLDRLSTTGNGAPDDVRMTVQVLRRAVHAKIEPRVDGPKVHGRGKRVVDDGGEAMLAREPDDALQICNFQQRIGHGLHVDGLRVRPQLCFPGAGVIRINEIERDTELLEVSRDEIVRAAVQPALCQQVIARG